jgi:large subunit ribosomal protein L17
MFYLLTNCKEGGKDMAGYRKLGRPTDQRKAMLRNLVTSFLKHGKIETTETRAKETRNLAEKMITLAKRGDLHARRQVLAFVTEEGVVANLFENIAPKYAERNGGYTRMFKVGPRRGDGAEVVILELV